MQSTRSTPQRQLVKKILENNYTHPTADEIYEVVRKQNSKISRGTVYRNLNILSEQGEIARLAMPVGPDHYDCVTSQHYHFVCRSCNKVMDTGIDSLDIQCIDEPELKGCVIEDYKLYLIGLCQGCKKEME